MKSASNLALFLVNRTVYARASAIFYQRNVFDFTAGQTADPESGMFVDYFTSLNVCTQFLYDRTNACSKSIYGFHMEISGCTRQGQDFLSVAGQSSLLC